MASTQSTTKADLEALISDLGSFGDALQEEVGFSFAGALGLSYKAARRSDRGWLLSVLPMLDSRMRDDVRELLCGARLVACYDELCDAQLDVYRLLRGATAGSWLLSQAVSRRRESGVVKALVPALPVRDVREQVVVGWWLPASAAFIAAGPIPGEVFRKMKAWERRPTEAEVVCAAFGVLKRISAPPDLRVKLATYVPWIHRALLAFLAGRAHFDSEEPLYLTLEAAAIQGPDARAALLERARELRARQCRRIGHEPSAALEAVLDELVPLGDVFAAFGLGPDLEPFAHDEAALLRRPCALLLLPEDHAVWLEVPSRAPIAAVLSWAEAQPRGDAAIASAWASCRGEARWIATWNAPADLHYETLVAGLRAFAPAVVLEGPVHQGSRPPRWVHRLRRALEQLGIASAGAVPRVGDLPTCGGALLDAEGFGWATMEGVVRALETVAREGRAGAAGVDPSALGGVVAQPERLAEGLDELAALLE